MRVRQLNNQIKITIFVQNVRMEKIVCVKEFIKSLNAFFVKQVFFSKSFSNQDKSL